MAKKDEFIINGQMMDYKTMRVFNFVVSCKDNWAVVTADNKKFLKAIVKAEEKAKNKYIKYIESKNWVVQHFPGMSAEQIKNKLEKELRASGGKINNG
jgi:hypothetical protein